MKETVESPKGVSVLIPMYNEENHIAGVLKGLIEVLSTIKLPWEVIVIDDGSIDRSVDRARGFSQVRLIQHKRNLGYGKALKTGIKSAQYENVVFFDADGQHPMELIPKLVERLINCDAVIGERKVINVQNFYRYLGKLFLRTAVWIFLGLRLTDLNCGFRGFKKSIISKYLHLLPNGFSASMTSTLIVFFRRYQVEYIPVTVTKRVGKSKLKEVRDGFKALNQILRMSMLFVPWRVFGTTGFALTIGGFLYGAVVYLRTSGFPPSAVMFISTGVSSISFGLLMDQIAEIRKERFED